MYLLVVNTSMLYILLLSNPARETKRYQICIKSYVLLYNMQALNLKDGTFCFCTEIP